MLTNNTPRSHVLAAKEIRDNRDPLSASYATTYAGVIAFIAVVHEGSFAGAAERLGVGRSAVSRSVQRLETQLNTRLFIRTTRSTALTNEGQVFYDSCQPGVECIIQSVDEMRELRNGAPKGLLRVAASTGFGRKVVAPLLSSFQQLYPDITLDLVLDDRPPDFVAGRIDVAFRDGRMDDSELVARQLIPMQMHMCVSPDYATRHGLPQSLDNLEEHRAISYRQPSGRVNDWEFRVNGARQSMTPRAALSFNDVDLVLQAVLDGEGVAQIPGYQVSSYLQSGQLLPCLVQYAPDDRGHYICYMSRRQLPSRIRVFVDYMTQHIRQMDLHRMTTFSAMPPRLANVNSLPEEAVADWCVEGTSL